MCILNFCFGVIIGVIVTILVILFLTWYMTKKIEKNENV